MKRPIYICLEGGEGTYKTTTSTALALALEGMGYRVLLTKEPGTSHLPVTIRLRELMLSNEFDESLTPMAREFLSQAIRSIHLEKLIYPALTNDQCDYIIQDRGMASGIVYATCCGINEDFIHELNNMVFLFIKGKGLDHFYDHTFVMKQDGLTVDDAIAAKNEFGNGDAVESRGIEFHTQVNALFDEFVEFADDPIAKVS